MTRILLLSLALAAGLAAVSAPALAHHGEEVKSMPDRERALHEVVTTEIETIDGFVMAFKAGIEKTDVKLTREAKAAYDKAEGLMAEAKALHRKDKHHAAYDKAREGIGALGPAVDELLDKKNAPPQVLAMIERQVQETGKRLDGIETHVQGHSNPAGKEASKRARTHHKEADKLWKAGKKKAGFVKLVEGLKDLDKAIRATWPEAR